MLWSEAEATAAGLHTSQDSFVRTFLTTNPEIVLFEGILTKKKKYDAVLNLCFMAFLKS